MACLRIVELRLCTGSSLRSNGMWSHRLHSEGLASTSGASSSHCGIALQTRAHPEAGRRRLDVLCSKKGQSRRTSKSHLRPKPSALGEVAAPEASTLGTASINEDRTMESTSVPERTMPTRSAPLAQAMSGGGVKSGIPARWRASVILKAKSISLNTIASMKSRAQAVVCSEAAYKLPARALPVAAGAVFGYFVVSVMFTLAHRMVSGFRQALSGAQSQPGNSKFLLETGKGRQDAWDQLQQQQQQWLRGGRFSPAGSSTSDLLRSNRNASLVPSSKLNKRKASKRVPLVVSAATPSTIYEQNTEESEWLLAEPVENSSLYAGSLQPAVRSPGRVPLMVSVATPSPMYSAAVSASGPADALTGQEVRLRATLDPTWVPTLHKPEPIYLSGPKEEEENSAGGKEALQAEVKARQRDALAASIAAQRVEEMQHAQEDRVSALKTTTELEARALEERHKKQLADLEAQLSAARKEASIASTIAKHFLESDANNVVTIRKGESASNGALPLQTPARPSPPRLTIELEDGMLKFEHMSEEMREVVRSFNSVLEMKLSKESAHRQAVEERLREAEMEQRILKERFSRAMAQTRLPPSNGDAVLTGLLPSRSTEVTAGSPANTPLQEVDGMVEQDAGSIYLAEVRRKLADAQEDLRKERLNAEEKEKAMSELEAKLRVTLRERDALGLERFQNTATEIAAFQELLAAQARANLEITTALQRLMEEAPVLQVQLAEVRMELDLERESRKADIEQMSKAVADAKAEAALLRIEATRTEEQYLSQIAELQNAKGSKVPFPWSSGKA